MLLNRDATGTPSENAGLEVERGDKPNAKFEWNEAQDFWTASYDSTGTPVEVVTTTKTGTLNLNISEQLNIDVADTITFLDEGVGSLSVNMDGNTSATLDAAGDLRADPATGIFALDRNATQYASFDENSGNLIIKSGTTTAATFSGADVTLAGDLAVNEDLTVGDSARVDGNMSIGGGLNIGGNFNADGNTTLHGTLDVDGATTLDSATINSTLYVDGDATFDNFVTLGTSGYTVSILADNTDITNTLNVDDAVDFNSTLAVQGVTTVYSKVDMNSNDIDNAKDIYLQQIVLQFQIT